MKNEVCIIVSGIYVFFNGVKKPFQCTDCSNFVSFREQILKKQYYFYIVLYIRTSTFIWCMKCSILFSISVVMVAKPYLGKTLKRFFNSLYIHTYTWIFFLLSLPSRKKKISGMDGPTITKEFCSLKTIHCLRWNDQQKIPSIPEETLLSVYRRTWSWLYRIHISRGWAYVSQQIISPFW